MPAAGRPVTRLAGGESAFDRRLGATHFYVCVLPIYGTKRAPPSSSLNGRSVMPLYFFHLSFGHLIVPDDEGIELPNRSAARAEASAVIRDLSNPEVPGNSRRWASWFLQVA